MEKGLTSNASSVSLLIIAPIPGSAFDFDSVTWQKCRRATRLRFADDGNDCFVPLALRAVDGLNKSSNLSAINKRNIEYADESGDTNSGRRSTNCLTTWVA